MIALALISFFNLPALPQAIVSTVSTHASTTTMGSYLTVVNDTADFWQCKVGPDEQALKIAGIIIGVITALAALIATVGAAAPVIGPLVGGGIMVAGVSTGAMATIASAVAAASTAATIIGAASEFALQIANTVNDVLQEKDFVQIPPGTKHRYGAMSLSLWQQSQCTRTVIVNEKSLRVDVLYMRPIFSGATADSNRDHGIQYWLTADGVTSEVVQGTTDPAPESVPVEAGVNTTQTGLDVAEDSDKIVYSANRTIVNPNAVVGDINSN